jgi:hypothetical protein
LSQKIKAKQNKKAETEAGGVTQWLNICLMCWKLWVPSLRFDLQHSKRKKETKEKNEKAWAGMLAYACPQGTGLNLTAIHFARAGYGRAF